MSDALDDLYGVFDRYARPKTFPACSCCMPDEDGQWGDGRTIQLPAPGGPGPLRQLTIDDLGAFAENVPGTCGDLRSFKHYLPRLLELARDTEPYTVVDFPEFGEMIAKLAHSDDEEFVPWWDWPEDEQFAIQAFLTEAWSNVCRSTDVHVVSDALRGLLSVAPDIQPYLDAWSSAPVDSLLRAEVVGWIERPSTEFGSPFARANWSKAKDWAAAQINHA